MACSREPDRVSRVSVATLLERGTSLEDNRDRQESELEVLMSMFGEDVTVITEKQEFSVRK